ncbi:MAG: hypothetical protein ACXV7J_16205 [Methylomonas sp.]
MQRQPSRQVIGWHKKRSLKILCRLLGELGKTRLTDAYEYLAHQFITGKNIEPFERCDDFINANALIVIKLARSGVCSPATLKAGEFLPSKTACFPSFNDGIGAMALVISKFRKEQ